MFPKASLALTKAPVALTKVPVASAVILAFVKALRPRLKMQRSFPKVLWVPGHLLQDPARVSQYWSDSLQRPRHRWSPSCENGGVEVQTGEGCEWKQRKNS